MTEKKEQISDEIIEGEALELTVTSADQFLPALTMDEARERYKLMKEFIDEQLIEDVDYGQIPGTKKATLLKPGAEKLTTLFGLRVTFIDERTIEKWENKEDPLFHYQRKCQLWKGNVLIAEASGSANSREGRYRWRWVNKDIAVAKYLDDFKTFDKRESVEGAFLWQIEQRNPQYGSKDFWDTLQNAVDNNTAKIFDKKQHWDNKIVSYAEISSFEYRTPNDDIYSLVNTILKMAEKRALVAATLIAVNASDYFTQDMEDIVEGVEVSKKEVAEKKPQKSAKQSDEEIKVDKDKSPLAGEKNKTPELWPKKALRAVLENSSLETDEAANVMLGWSGLSSKKARISAIVQFTKWFQSGLDQDMSSADAIKHAKDNFGNGEQ